MNPRCASANPLTCRYHGTRSKSYITALRNKVIVAHSVYKAAEGINQWKAYENVREAEIEYYATDEGQQRLINALKTTQAGEYRNQLLDMQQKSSETRFRLELEDSDSYSKWQLPPPEPKMITQTMELTPEPIYSGVRINNHDEFTWDEITGAVTYVELDESGNEDLDSMRLLGHAHTRQAAAELTNRWLSLQNVS